ncbi:MAG: D-alanine--D-alanine ligase, partial [Paludibacteraceae bacterium]
MKKNIAIIAGGDSSEVVVSLKSASGIKSFIDAAKYNAYIVTIVGQKWNVEISDTEKLPLDKNDFAFTRNGKKIKFDFSYITIHGTPGENGILQGYFDLIKMPYSTCGVLTSAITFNKFVCNQYLKGFGVKVEDSILLRRGQTVSDDEVEAKLGLPCFVKPNVGGSSFGVTKVKEMVEIQPAIEKAFAEGEEVLIEKLITGKEFTCGIYKTHEKTVVLPVTEIIPKNEFFDFGAKYKNESEEITPARISKNLTDRIQQLTTAIYDILGCKGIVRVDYIVSEKEIINLLEVNTTPGMTTTSFIPQQVAAAGMTMNQVMTDIIESKL